MIGWLCVQLGDSSKTVSIDTYVYRSHWRRGIVHIRADSNSWCLCLLIPHAWNHPPLGWPQTRGWAISGLLSVSTPLDHFSLSFSFCLSICISLSRSLAINVRCFHIPPRELHRRWEREREILLIPVIRSKIRRNDSLDPLWHPTFSRGCAKLMSLEREILGANIYRFEIW